MVGKSSESKCVKNILLGYNPHDRLFVSKLLSSWREVWLNKHKFFASISIFDIKYNHLELQNDNIFYLFKYQLDHSLAYYFTESKTTKGNIDWFLFDQLMVPLTKKLFYHNVDK